MNDLDYDQAIDYQIQEWEDHRNHELHDLGICAGPGWCHHCGDETTPEF